MKEREFNMDNAAKLTALVGKDNTVATITAVATNLPSAEEFAEMENSITHQFAHTEWSEPKYQCPKCGGGMCKDLMTICTSIPPMYRYRCNMCGHIDYHHI